VSDDAQTQTQPEAGAGNFLSFWTFFSEAFVPLNKISLPLKALHKQTCDVLQAAVLNELPPHLIEGVEYPIQYVILNMSPRVGKTKMCEALPCWLAAYFPDSQSIYTSYSQTLVERSIRYIGETMAKPWYIDLFGAHIKNSRAELLTTYEGGQVYGAGTGASITGFGAGLKRKAGGFIVVDDPAKPDEALSQVESANVRRWFETTLKSRRNSDKYCPIIICAQRLAIDDLCGYVLETYPKETLHIKFPAMVDGESVIPETISTATLTSMEATRTGRFVLASQYMQEPVAAGGNLIPIDSFYRFDPATYIKFDKRIITVDTALKTKQANDYSCFQLWGRANKRAYLCDQMWGKWESPDLYENAKTFWEKHGSTEGQPRPRMIIEEKAAGTPLLQQLRRAGVPAEGIERNIDKVQRVQSVLQFIEAGLVYLPKDGSTPWIAGTLTEFAQFSADGTATHDDRVDTMVDGVEHLLGKTLSSFDVLFSKKPAT